MNFIKIILILCALKFVMAFDQNKLLNICTKYSKVANMTFDECMMGAELLVNQDNYIKNTSMANCNRLACASLITTCALTCACDFPVCECCPMCVACLGSMIAECCDCVLPAYKCPGYVAKFKHLVEIVKYHEQHFMKKETNDKTLCCNYRSMSGSCQTKHCAVSQCAQVVYDQCGGVTTQLHASSAWEVPTCRDCY